MKAQLKARQANFSIFDFKNVSSDIFVHYDTRFDQSLLKNALFSNKGERGTTQEKGRMTSPSY